jgi:hypothetical protein
MDPNVGTSHGKQSWLRLDTSSVASMITLGALLFLVWVSVNFRGAVSASAGISRR